MWNPFKRRPYGDSHLTARQARRLEEMRSSGEWCCLELVSDYGYVWDVRAIPEGSRHDEPVALSGPYSHQRLGQAVDAAWRNWVRKSWDSSEEEQPPHEGKVGGSIPSPSTSLTGGLMAYLSALLEGEGEDDYRRMASWSLGLLGTVAERVVYSYGGVRGSDAERLFWAAMGELDAVAPEWLRTRVSEDFMGSMVAGAPDEAARALVERRVFS